MGDRPVVIRDDQRIRPQGEAEIAAQHARLRPQVGQRAHTVVEADGVAARTRRHQCGQDEPGRGQAEVQRPAAGQRRPPRRVEKNPIEERQGERRRDHDLLARHAQGAGGNGGGAPRPGALRGGRPDRGVQGEQVEHGHEQFGALQDVDHGFAVQRMQRPDGRHRPRQPGRVRAAALGQSRRLQGPPQHAEQQNRGGQVQGDIHRPVAADIETADRVVQGE